MDLVNDSLTEYSYDADLAGLSYSLIAHNNGIYITVDGYNDKVDVLLKHVIDNVKNVHIEPGRFAAITKEVNREWMNFFLGQSYTLADYFARHLLSERHWTVDEKMRQLPSEWSASRTQSSATNCAVSREGRRCSGAGQECSQACERQDSCLG
jgi:insulysin